MTLIDERMYRSTNIVWPTGSTEIQRHRKLTDGRDSIDSADWEMLSFEWWSLLQDTVEYNEALNTSFNIIKQLRQIEREREIIVLRF